MEWIKKGLPYVVIGLVVVIIRTFIITPVKVDGESMDPTLKDGDVMMLKKYDNTYEYGDIVILNYYESKFVKRIIGLPGDSIKYKNGKLYVNGKKKNDKFSIITKDFYLSDLGYDEIPKGYYFVLGDNRNGSSDSRTIGLIKENDILGVSSFRIFPFTSFGNVK